MTNGRIALGWPIFVWPMITFSSIILLGLGLGALLSSVPNKWDRATAISVCGRFVVLRQEDGSIWLRINSIRAYRIENDDWKTFCK
jgi:hypothetical protein